MMYVLTQYSHADGFQIGPAVLSTCAHASQPSRTNTNTNTSGYRGYRFPQRFLQSTGGVQNRFRLAYAEIEAILVSLIEPHASGDVQPQRLARTLVASARSIKETARGVDKSPGIARGTGLDDRGDAICGGGCQSATRPA